MKTKTWHSVTCCCSQVVLSGKQLDWASTSRHGWLELPPPPRRAAHFAAPRLAATENAAAAWGRHDDRRRQWRQQRKRRRLCCALQRFPVKVPPFLSTLVWSIESGAMFFYSSMCIIDRHWVTCATQKKNNRSKCTQRTTERPTVAVRQNNRMHHCAHYATHTYTNCNININVAWPGNFIENGMETLHISNV